MPGQDGAHFSAPCHQLHGQEGRQGMLCPPLPPPRLGPRLQQPPPRNRKERSPVVACSDSATCARVLVSTWRSSGMRPTVEIVVCAHTRTRTRTAPRLGAVSTSSSPCQPAHAHDAHHHQQRAAGRQACCTPSAALQHDRSRAHPTHSDRHRRRQGTRPCAHGPRRLAGSSGKAGDAGAAAAAGPPPPPPIPLHAAGLNDDSWHCGCQQSQLFAGCCNPSHTTLPPPILL